MDQSVQVTSQEGVTTLTSVIEIPTAKENVWEVLKFPGQVEEFHPLNQKVFYSHRHPKWSRSPAALRPTTHGGDG